MTHEPDVLCSSSYSDGLSKSNDIWLKEDKVIINGIIVRAAELPKLLEFLIDSFGKSI
jgi:hypothetical protein